MKSVSKFFNWFYQTLKGKTESEILWEQVQALPTFEPFYLQNGFKYYQVIRENEVIRVNTHPFKNGVKRKVQFGTHPLVTAFMHRQLPEQFQPITGATFHEVYTRITKKNNLLHKKNLS